MGQSGGNAEVLKCLSDPKWRKHGVQKIVIIENPMVDGLLRYFRNEMEPEDLV